MHSVYIQPPPPLPFSSFLTTFSPSSCPVLCLLVCLFSASPLHLYPEFYYSCFCVFGKEQLIGIQASISGCTT